jgi:hypothetical protein
MQALARVEPHESSKPSGQRLPGSWEPAAQEAWARLERLRKVYARDRGAASAAVRLRASDENGPKNPIPTSVSIFFLTETKSGSENTGSETESKYADIRKRTNTDGEPKN